MTPIERGVARGGGGGLMSGMRRASSSLASSLSKGVGKRAPLAPASSALLDAADAAMTSADTRQRASYSLLLRVVYHALRAKELDAERTLTCFVMSTADLLEFGDLLVDVARDHVPIVMLFVPTIHIKSVVKQLNALTDDYAKSSPDRAPQQFLSATFAKLTADGIGLSVFNLLQN